MRLKPTERLILYSLRCKPGQTIAELAESTDTRHRYRLGESIRLLIASGLVYEEPYTVPTGYLVTNDGIRHTMTAADWPHYANGEPLPTITKRMHVPDTRVVDGGPTIDLGQYVAERF